MSEKIGWDAGRRAERLASVDVRLPPLAKSFQRCGLARFALFALSPPLAGDDVECAFNDTRNGTRRDGLRRGLYDPIRHFRANEKFEGSDPKSTGSSGPRDSLLIDRLLEEAAYALVDLSDFRPALTVGSTRGRRSDRRRQTLDGVDHEKRRY